MRLTIFKLKTVYYPYYNSAEVLAPNWRQPSVMQLPSFPRSVRLIWMKEKSGLPLIHHGDQQQSRGNENIKRSVYCPRIPRGLLLNEVVTRTIISNHRWRRLAFVQCCRYLFTLDKTHTFRSEHSSPSFSLYERENRNPWEKRSFPSNRLMICNRAERFPPEPIQLRSLRTVEKKQSHPFREHTKD